VKVAQSVMGRKAVALLTGLGHEITYKRDNSTNFLEHNRSDPVHHSYWGPMDARKSKCGVNDFGDSPDSDWKS
jgi:hypothetical protein